MTSLIHSNDAVLLTVLRDGGWQEGRTEPVSQWLEQIAKSGIVTFDAATALLSEFGGLFLRIPYDIPGVPDASAEIHFNPIKAISGDEDRLAYWERLMEERFYPIGAYDGYLLLISQAGAIYMDAHGSGYWIGGNIEEALQNFILNYRNVEKVLDIPGQKRLK